MCHHTKDTYTTYSKQIPDAPEACDSVSAMMTHTLTVGCIIRH